MVRDCGDPGPHHDIDPASHEPVIATRGPSKRVRPSGHAWQMTDDEVIEAAAVEGFELSWRPVGGRLCVGFVRGDDERYPAFGEERLAISYMADWLRRGRVFV